MITNHDEGRETGRDEKELLPPHFSLPAVPSCDIMFQSIKYVPNHNIAQ